MVSHSRPREENMRAKPILAFLVVLAAGVAGCSPSSPLPVPEATAKSTTGNAAGSESAGSDATASCDDLALGDDHAGSGNSPLLRDGAGKVLAQANIFGAGRGAPPAPGGGGGGVLPPVSVLAAGPSRVVTLSRVTGRVNPIRMYPDWNGPAGDRIGPTDVKSFQGISGIVHRTNGMFLVGVFLTDAPPSNPAPPRLDFSTSDSSSSQAVWVTNGEQFDVLAPEIGQTFYIGSGKGRSYVVPAEATRLFLGFADGYLYVGCPGWYENNAGNLTVTVKVTEG
jgi:hypothetical protein